MMHSHLITLVVFSALVSTVFAVLLRDPVWVLALTLGLMALKALVLLGLARIFRLRTGDGWLMTLGLAQAGEFGFVLFGAAKGGFITTFRGISYGNTPALLSILPFCGGFIGGIWAMVALPLMARARLEEAWLPLEPPPRLPPSSRLP